MPAAEETIQGQSRRLKQGLRQFIKRKPAELGEGAGFGQPGFLVSNVRQELKVDVVLFVGQDVGDTKELEVGHLHSQFLQGFPPGAFLQGFTPFQVAAGRGPASLSVGSLSLGEENPAVADQHHAHADAYNLRGSGILRRHGPSISWAIGTKKNSKESGARLVSKPLPEWLAGLSPPRSIIFASGAADGPEAGSREESEKEDLP